MKWVLWDIDSDTFFGTLLTLKHPPGTLKDLPGTLNDPPETVKGFNTNGISNLIGFVLNLCQISGAIETINHPKMA